MKRWHLVLIIILLSGSWLVHWPLSPRQEIKLLVVNKTVPDTTFREHRAIFWVAEHRRFSKPTCSSFTINVLFSVIQKTPSNKIRELHFYPQI